MMLQMCRFYLFLHISQPVHCTLEKWAFDVDPSIQNRCWLGLVYLVFPRLNVDGMWSLLSSFYAHFLHSKGSSLHICTGVLTVGGWNLKLMQILAIVLSFFFTHFKYLCELVDLGLSFSLLGYSISSENMQNFWRSAFFVWLAVPYVLNLSFPLLLLLFSFIHINWRSEWYYQLWIW